MLKLAVILINYNSSNYTIKCVESILDKTDKNLDFKIYIVDNNSEFNDYNNLNNYFNNTPNNKVFLHRSHINKGFGGGNMFGWQFAEPAEYVAFVNNDTFFLNDCLTILYNYIKENNTIGIVGGQSFKENGEEIISFDHYASTTRQIFGRGFLEKINQKKYPKRKKTYTNPMQVNTVAGSLMIINAADFNQIGGFDENLFLYYEETDICLRLKSIGKSCFIIPKAKYIHYISASSGESMLMKKELKISLVYLVQKHYGWFSKKILLVYLIIATFFASFVKPKKWTTFKLFIQGAPLSKSLKQRQKITNF